MSTANPPTEPHQWTVDELVPKIKAIAAMLHAAPPDDVLLIARSQSASLEWLADEIREANRREVFEGRRDEIHRAGEAAMRGIERAFAGGGR